MQDQTLYKSHRDKVTEDILCAATYITLLPAVAILLFPRFARNRRIRFHACQSILLNWLLVSASFMFHLRAGIDQLLDIGNGAQFVWAARVLCMVVLSIAALSLARGVDLRIPFLASLADRQVDGWLFRRLGRARAEVSMSANPGLKEAIQLSS